MLTHYGVRFGKCQMGWNWLRREQARFYGLAKLSMPGNSVSSTMRL